MADVFISYRNTPDRRAIVRRLATILRAYEVTVWWDYGLEAGESYRSQIMSELANARIVSPIWCAESVVSRWVQKEAECGKDKLVPARLQKVAPPDAFEAIQAADLIGWDGAVGSPRLQAFVRRVCERLGRKGEAPTDLIEELANLPLVQPLPEFVPAAAPAHDTAFWERQWEKQGAGNNLVALRAIAEEAPRYFANQARARIAEIEGEQTRIVIDLANALVAKTEAEGRETAVARYQAEGRIKVDAKIIHGAPDGWFKPRAGKSECFKDLDMGPEMVVVPAGEFLMGLNDYVASRPAHRVTIQAPFAVGRFAVTFAEWDAAGLAHEPGDAGWGRGRRPVVNVSWEDARAYASWLSERTAKVYRLLSEAEWEYCCRAGTTTRHAYGDSITMLQAQYSERRTGSTKRTAEVGTFPPNAWGLCDAHGNVWEWCEDSWHTGYEGAPQDGSVWAGGDVSRRVLRGGSWFYDPSMLPSDNRFQVVPSARTNQIGFRLARML